MPSDPLRLGRRPVRPGPLFGSWGGLRQHQVLQRRPGRGRHDVLPEERELVHVLGFLRQQHDEQTLVLQEAWREDKVPGALRLGRHQLRQHALLYEPRLLLRGEGRDLHRVYEDRRGQHVLYEPCEAAGGLEGHHLGRVAEAVGGAPGGPRSVAGGDVVFLLHGHPPRLERGEADGGGQKEQGGHLWMQRLRRLPLLEIQQRWLEHGHGVARQHRGLREGLGLGEAGRPLLAVRLDHQGGRRLRVSAQPHPAAHLGPQGPPEPGALLEEQRPGQAGK
mmetsp:Transcript_61804/g.188723  ORF Transcript_61804/g.188723 Transcript_61804/m.188723 type:complete len:277 (-) Transcript_61804:274-1104(-)